MRVCVWFWKCCCFVAKLVNFKWVNVIAEKGQLPASTSDQAPMHFTYIAHSDCTTVNKDVTQIIPGIGHSTSTNENLKGTTLFTVVCYLYYICTFVLKTITVYDIFHNVLTFCVPFKTKTTP